jgi:ATP-dependent RNA helicase RhlB
MTEENQPENQPEIAPAPRADKPRFLTRVAFDGFQLPACLLDGLKDAGFIHCTPIQAQSLPVSLCGRDVAGQAQTGTGKTAAFLVTVITRLLGDPDRQAGKPAALIVAPTRELAAQIYEEACQLGRHCGLDFTQVVGGIDYQRQADQLRQGTDVVICTPGRIIDYLKQGIFKPDAVRIVVIDEADRLLDLGFADDMRFILRKLPHYDKRQSLLFSATLAFRVMELTYEYMNLPEFIAVTPEEITVEGVEQALYHVGSDNKLPLLLGLLKREEWTRLLIFVNTKSGVEWLTRKLVGNGWPAEGITGDLPQRKRFQLMERFKDGSVKILIATDVASRGIHVEDISHVINYDIPQDPENYVHRIGRTARAGKTGRAITLACETYVFHLEPLEELLGYKLPVQWPADEWLVADQAGPVHSQRPRDGKRGSQGRRPSREARGGPRPAREGRPARPSAERQPPAQPEAPPAERETPERERDRSRRREGAPVSRRDAPIQRGPGYFPGTFFGFAPPGKAALAAEPDTEALEIPLPAAPSAYGTPGETPSASAPESGAKAGAAPEAGGPPSADGAPKPEKRRKRRPRRRRKHPGAAVKTPGEAEAQAESVAAGPQGDAPTPRPDPEGSL